MVDADIEALSHEGRPWIDKVNLQGWGADDSAKPRDLAPASSF
jgi:hypothetical protein